MLRNARERDRFRAMRNSQFLADTIVAQATPPGLGAVALLRLSGPRATEIAGLLTRRDPAEWLDRTSTLCALSRPEPGGEVLDQALVTVFRAPASYTGEDIVEISTHGGRETPASVTEACVELGARRALPGEFTQRAYLNGKLDLTQAEAVAGLVAAKSSKSRAVALHQLEKGLADRVAMLRERLVELSALLVQHIDFPEEDDAPVALGAIVAQGREMVREVERLLATAPAGELLQDGAMAVLAGRPNSGKSSLFNGLLGLERAIVTEEAGTTRDAVEAAVSIDGFPFRLVDTAGLRDDAERIERLGIEVARRYLEGADVVLYCREAGASADTEAERAFLASVGAPVVQLRTKWDLAEDGESAEAGEIAVSVRSGEGMTALKDALRELVFRGAVENRDEVPVVTTRRQARCLGAARAETEAFCAALDNGVPPEVASAHLKSAESALEDVLGVVAADDVLDRVFKDFCIGK